MDEEMLRALTTLIEALTTQVHEMSTKLDNHITARLKERGELVDSLLSRAFPDGDAEGHRRHHEAAIKAAEDRAKFWEEMRIELGKYGLIGFIGWAAYSLWQAFLQGPHK